MSEIAVPSGGPKARCTGKRSDGERCGNPAGFGTGHPGVGPCKNHYGSTPTQEGKYARIRIKDAALQHLVSTGQVLDVENLTGVQALREELVRSYVMVSWLEEQTDTDMAMWPDWQAVLLNERKHMVHVAATMLRSGIEERSVRIMEKQAELLAGTIRQILTGLQLTPEQQMLAPGIVRSALGELTAAGVN